MDLDQIRGMDGESLKAVQQKLKNAGLNDGAIDGAYGPQTERAVLGHIANNSASEAEKQQRANSLPPLSMTALGRQLGNLGMQKERRGGVTHYMNVRLAGQPALCVVSQ